MKIKHGAVLIAGSEQEFVKSINAMAGYLGSLGVSTLIYHHEESEKVLAGIKNMSSQISEDGVLLVVIFAHGAKNGIESPSISKRLFYKDMVAALPKKRTRVQFVTSTCYGQFLIKYLIGKRCGMSTGVITAWEGFRETYDDVIADVLQAWKKRKLPEDFIGRHSFSGELSYDSEFSGVQRWGAIHDEYFFAPK